MLATRTHWRLLIATILLLMAAAFLTPKVVLPPDIQENRVLAPKPVWPRHLSEIRAFRQATDAYVADHFPSRRHLIGLLNRGRMLAGVTGSNRVVVGRDGWLFYDDDTHMGAARNDPPMPVPEVRTWLLSLAGRTEMLKARGIPYLVVTPPVKEILYPQHAPAWYRGASPDRPSLNLARLAKAADIGEVLYLGPAVQAATKPGEATYSLHDTHWTGYGAYAGYAALMTRLHAMGLAEGPRPRSDFPKTTLLGINRPRDLALMLGVSSFVHLDFPHFDNPAGQAKISKTFLGPRQDWTAPQIYDTGEVGKPTLLMTRDSFSNELLPFMYSHFSRIILAHNQDGFWRQDLIDRYRPDIVISEVLESGLRFSEGDGPPASPEATARIDHVLTVTAPPKTATALAMPTLAPPDARTLAALNAAKITPNCNLEMAKIAPGVGGEATVSLSGWLSELAPKIASPKGLARLSGPGGDFVGPIRVDGARPDVAAFYKVPTGAESGFLATYLMKKLPAGAYKATVYRPAAEGWIGCTGPQPLMAP